MHRCVLCLSVMPPRWAPHTAYNQIVRNPVYSAAFASLSLVFIAWLKARAQRFLSNILLTQLTLGAEASEKL